MPFCPTCRQEFESFASRCPDCEVALVPELGAPPPAAQAAAPDAITLVGEDADVAAHILRLLGAHGIPATGGTAAADGMPVVVPTEFARAAYSLLSKDRGLVAVDAGETIRFHRADPAANMREQAALDRGLLKRPTSELVDRGAEVIGALLDFVRVGSAEERQRAAYVICRMGEPGQRALARQLAVLVQDASEEAVYGVVRELRERLKDATLLADVVAIAGDAAVGAEVRGLALHALGRFELPALAAGILPLLSDADLAIRELADEALCSIADDDMGFDPAADAAGRAESIARWRRFFKMA